MHTFRRALGSSGRGRNSSAPARSAPTIVSCRSLARPPGPGSPGRSCAPPRSPPAGGRSSARITMARCASRTSFSSTGRAGSRARGPSTAKLGMRASIATTALDTAGVGAEAEGVKRFVHGSALMRSRSGRACGRASGARGRAGAPPRRACPPEALPGTQYLLPLRGPEAQVGSSGSSSRRAGRTRRDAGAGSRHDQLDLQTTIARSITLASSRTLPGQG